jgi:trigger factor
VKSALETLNPTRVKMTVEVPYEELKPSLDAAYRTIGQQIQVPGFRKGKVPARIIDQRVGRGAVLQEAVNEALPKFYGQAVDENNVRPLGQPEVDVTEVPAEEGQELKFTAEVDVRPDITLPDYDGITVEVDSVHATDADVDERITTLRQRFGTLKGVDRPAQDGDFVSIDLTASIDGEEIDTVTGVSYEVGTKNMLDGIDEALVGMTAGETKSFTAPLAGGDHAGRDADCVVTVQSVKERELPELDDDFAQLASEFDTLDDLRADVVKQAEQAKRFEQGVQARDRILEQLLDSVDVPVPDGIVEAEVHSHLEGESRLEDDEHRAEVGESTRKALKTQLLLDAIVEKEEISVEQPELIEYIVMSAQQYGMDPNEFAQAIDQQGQVPAMVAEVARRKALAHVLEHASVVDTTGATVDLDAIVAPGAEDEVLAGDGHDQHEHEHEHHDHEHDHQHHDHEHHEHEQAGEDPAAETAPTA